MAYKRALSAALSRSLEDAKNSLARAVRMDVLAPSGPDHDTMLMYALHTREDIGRMAIGCDGDIGGLSTVKVDLDREDGRGRFFGTLSSELPRGTKLERSGYAGTRNKNRSTLFGSQTWDSTFHPFIRLRVRDRLARPITPPTQLKSDAVVPPRLIVPSNTVSADEPVREWATRALGLHRSEKPGPKFFVNLQTDGPVTTDLFQHRLFLDESLGNAWQDVIIPLSNFILTNSGQVSPNQVRMMRQAIRTVGISVMLEHPIMHLPEFGIAKGKDDPFDTSRPPSALRREESGNVDEVKRQAAIDSRSGRSNEDPANIAARTTSARGSRRGMAFNFDLGIDSIAVLNGHAVDGRESGS